MSKLRYCTLILILLLMACTAQDAAIPTLMELPSITPSFTPTDTPTATATPTETATATATDTPTATFTPTVTPTNTNTPFPLASPTNTLTPAPTATFTPTLTLTPLPTRTPNAPEILLFEADKTVANHGDPVHFHWETDGDAARIERLNQAGDVVEIIPVNTVGSYETNLPPDGIVAIYRLVAVRDDMQARSSIAFDFAESCNFDWFFEPAQDIGCPASGLAGARLTYQQFDRGFMIHFTSQGTDRVCGVQNNNNLYSCFESRTYSGTPPPPATPTHNHRRPGQDFRYVFYNNLAVGGFWYDVIGWATSQQVTSSAETQVSVNGIRYIRTPQGILGFDQNLTGSAMPVIRVPEL